MKEYLDRLGSRSILTKVSDQVSVDYDIASILLSLEDKPIIFENIEGFSIRAAGNLFANRDLLALGLGIQGPNLVSKLQDAIDSPSDSKGTVAGFSESSWDHNERADLSKLPILKHFENEAGRYLTAGIVVAKFPNSSSENLSFHRMLVLDKDKVAARIVPRHLNQIMKEGRGEKIRVSVAIGPPPAVFVAASLQTKFGASEYNIANKLNGEKLRLSNSELSEIAYPSDTEILLEGWLDASDQADEGPFVDLTGTYDEVRRQPVIKFDRMHYNDDSVYQAVVASSSEHSLFMGLPQELKISQALSNSIPRTRGINLTPASNGYFHCIVSIDKGNDGDGKTAILNCFAASHPLKLVIAVDSDVDPFDLSAVEWALATRFQAESGLVVISGARGSSLDPSSGKLAVTSKMGLDATLPIKADRSKYARANLKFSNRSVSVLKALGFQIGPAHASQSAKKIAEPAATM